MDSAVIGFKPLIKKQQYEITHSLSIGLKLREASIFHCLISQIVPRQRCVYADRHSTRCSNKRSLFGSKTRWSRLLLCSLRSFRDNDKSCFGSLAALKDGQKQCYYYVTTFFISFFVQCLVKITYKLLLLPGYFFRYTLILFLPLPPYVRT